jgi:hypothetical protein
MYFRKKYRLEFLNEKLSRRVIFMTDGHIEPSVIEEINERNEKTKFQ